MKAKGYVFAILLLAAVPMSSGAEEGFPAHPRLLRYPERKMPFPPVQRSVLKNGMVVYLLEDHSQPYMSLTALVRSGSVWDPVGREGLARLTAECMRSAGTRRFPADEMNRRLEILAAEISSSSERDSASASLWTLSRTAPEALDIFFSMLREPTFETAKVEVERRKTMEAIRRQSDSPRELTPREFLRLVYGNHPYAHPETGGAASVAAVSEADMRACHAAHYRPGNIILAAAGDVKKADFLRTLTRLTAGWDSGKTEKFAVPPVPEQPFRPGVYYLEKPLTQTNLRMGHLGIRRDDPNYFVVRAMNDILGGGLSFSSRLVSRVRTREGLAYSVGSRFVDLDDIGYFFASTQTRADATHRAVSLMREEIERIRREPVSEDELRQAKEGIINGLPFTFETPEKAARALAELEYQGLPRDHYEKLAERVNRVTREDVLQAAKHYLRPDHWVLLVVGNEKGFDRLLAEWGGEVFRLKDAEGAPPGLP